MLGCDPVAGKDGALTHDADPGELSTGPEQAGIANKGCWYGLG